MKYLTVLAVHSILAAANPFLRRQETDTQKLLTLRANFCIDANKPECQEAIGKCQDESKMIKDCIRDEHPACIQPESSPCSKDVAQCLIKFGKEEDADQAVKDCIVEKGISGPDANGDADSEQAVSGNLADVDQISACKKPSLEFEEAWLKNDCDGTNDTGESSGAAPQESKSPACEKANVTFEQAWTANNCEAAFSAAIGNAPTPEGDSDTEVPST